MKKQFLFAAAFMAAFALSDINAAAQDSDNNGIAALDLLVFLGKAGISGACAERLYKFESNSKFTDNEDNLYLYGFEKIAYLGGSSILLTALWKGYKSTECKTAAVLSALCALTHAVANCKAVTKLLRQVPVMGNILTDYSDKNDKEVCSVGVMSRYILTCALIRESLRYVTRGTTYDITPYLLDFSKA